MIFFLSGLGGAFGLALYKNLPPMSNSLTSVWITLIVVAVASAYFAGYFKGRPSNKAVAVAISRAKAEAVAHAMAQVNVHLLNVGAIGAPNALNEGAVRDSLGAVPPAPLRGPDDASLIDLLHRLGADSTEGERVPRTVVAPPPNHAPHGQGTLGGPPTPTTYLEPPKDQNPHDTGPGG